MNMNKKLLCGLLLAAVSSPAMSQAWQDPDWLDGSVPAPNWSLTPTNPTGTVAADAYEAPEVTETGFVEADWITSGSSGDYVQAVGRERKFRLTCQPSTAKQVDPILGLGINPFGHRHQGNGNVNWNQNSTYASLRASPSSTCTGGPLNGVIYWEPEMLKHLASGVDVGIRPDVQIFYYINGVQGDPQKLTWLRRNFAFIGGSNPADMNDQTRRNEYSAASLVYPGTADTMPGFKGWQCYPSIAAVNGGNAVTVSRTGSRFKNQDGSFSTTVARHFVAEDGTDPWGGACTGSIATPGYLTAQLTAPSCWDAHNLRSPDGRSHVRYGTRTPSNSVTGLCPDGWAQVPQLTAQTRYSHEGWNDYQHWFLSSDRMNPVGTAADATSKDPCRQISAWFCPGATLHFDWMFGWKSDIIDEWERECLGITVRGVAPVNGPAECNNSQISKTRRLLYGGTSPDPSLSGGCATILGCNNSLPGGAERYNPLPPGTTGDFVITHPH